MEKIIAGVALNEITKKRDKKLLLTQEYQYITYGCWTTGLAVIAFLGHSTYLKNQYSKRYLPTQFRKNEFITKPAKLYLPVIFNQLLASFCYNKQEVFLLSLSSAILLYKAFVNIPYIEFMSCALTCLACVLKFKQIK